MKTIALICPSSSGHHETYLRLFARILLELGYAVVAFSPTPDDVSAWVARRCPHLSGGLRAIELRYSRKHRVPGPASVFFDKLAWVWFIGQSIKAADVHPDLVFHTWLDNCVTPGLTSVLTNLVFPFRWSGLYFHPWYLRQSQKYAWLRHGPLANHDALRSRRCPCVAVLDEGVAEKLQAQLGGKPIIVFPDIVDDSPPDPGFLPALQIREKANGRKIIGLLGVLSKRKGVLVLMQVARQATQENWYFVFAGELAKESFSSQEQQEILEFAQSKPSNCFFHWQRIPDEAQFNALVNECDVLFAVYQNFLSSSNLLTKAALFQKPVLVSDAYCMGERVRKFGIGLVIAENSVPQCVAALYRLCDPMAQDQQLPVARFDEYLRLHSIEQLRTAFQAVLTAASL